MSPDSVPDQALTRDGDGRRDGSGDRPRGGRAAVRARGRAGGRRPRLTIDQAALAQQLYDGGKHTVAQIAAMFGVPRSTVYGHLDKTTIGNRPTIRHGEPVA
ncbi:helix-turn-helix domain-containing protein [Frankia sp. QA3]|uniref:helix-turn-helix domain-containing protein n=1 Tax=Frankia sp. QA3 TaxID=710111 RepID=UPI000269C20B|nr:helix-turn-helix domain-containing protein [Frankia sp. QA3]EIV92131.1 site-specific recombinase, DNA invertase Pin [Frankia sp. QA3]